MRIHMTWLWFVAAVALASCAAPVGTPDTTVTIGTFNIEWLGDGVNDRKARTDADYLRIADIIVKSGADVVGVQEIENQTALQKVLRYLDGFSGMVSTTGGDQRVGVIYRNTITVEPMGEYTALQLDRSERLRPGFIVRCRRGSFDWLQMVVHLKSTSRYDSTTALMDESRLLRRQQAAVLRSWVDSVLQAGKEADVVITGDLNDFPGRRSNSTLDALRDGEQTKFLTADLTSCKNPKWTVIDHIVVSPAMQKRLLPGSVRTENMFNFLSAAEVEAVSDHCPVVARFSTLATVRP